MTEPTQNGIAPETVAEAEKAVNNRTPEWHTKRQISHDEAHEIAQRLINSHFHLEPHARVGIPARPDYDDDLLISAYIDQQQAREAATLQRQPAQSPQDYKGCMSSSDGIDPCADYANLHQQFTRLQATVAQSLPQGGDKYNWQRCLKDDGEDGRPCTTCGAYEGKPCRRPAPGAEAVAHLLSKLCDEIESTEEHGDGAHDESCSICLTMQAARAALRPSMPAPAQGVTKWWPAAAAPSGQRLLYAHFVDGELSWAVSGYREINGVHWHAGQDPKAFTIQPTHYCTFAAVQAALHPAEKG